MSAAQRRYPKRAFARCKDMDEWHEIMPSKVAWLRWVSAGKLIVRTTTKLPPEK